MTRKRKIWLGAGGGLVVLFLIISAFVSQGSDVTYVTETVKRGTLARTVEVTGELESLTDVSLSFDASGPLARVYVEVGDSVRAGELLAELRADDVGARLDEAAQVLAQAEADLALQYAGVAPEEIAVQEAAVAASEASVEAARAALTSVYLEAARTEDVGAANLVDAEAKVEIAKTDSAEVLSQAREDLMAEMRAALIDVRNGLSEADEILGVENNLFNQDFDEYLANLNSVNFERATSAFEEARILRNKAEEAVLGLPSISPDPVELAAARVWVTQAFSATSNTLLHVSRVLDGTSADTDVLTLEDLTTFKANITASRTSLEVQYQGFLSASQTFDTAFRESTERGAQAVRDLNSARANAAKNDASFHSAVTDARASVAVREAEAARAYAELAKITADPREVDVAGLKAVVRRANAQYAAALAEVAKTRIVAPADGRVTDVAFDRGEQVSLGSPVINLLAREGAYKITVDIPEADIIDVARDMQASVTFDALGDDTLFVGKVVAVDPAEKLVQGVVFYEATVVLDEGQDMRLLKPGLSADITILSASVEEALLVPQRAILEYENDQQYVRVMTGEETYDERDVVVGLRGDEGIVEIWEGLFEGETILVTTREKK